MTKAELLNVLRIAGLGENAVILAGNAFDLGVEAEREECAKFFTENDTNLFWGSQVASLIRARGQE